MSKEGTNERKRVQVRKKCLNHEDRSPRLDSTNFEFLQKMDGRTCMVKLPSGRSRRKEDSCRTTETRKIPLIIQNSFNFCYFKVRLGVFEYNYLHMLIYTGLKKRRHSVPFPQFSCKPN